MTDGGAPSSCTAPALRNTRVRTTSMHRKREQVPRGRLPLQHNCTATSRRAVLEASTLVLLSRCSARIQIQCTLSQGNNDASTAPSGFSGLFTVTTAAVKKKTFPVVARSRTHRDTYDWGFDSCAVISGVRHLRSMSRTYISCQAPCNSSTARTFLIEDRQSDGLGIIGTDRSKQAAERLQ